ncbi:flagellar biosynthesis protein FlgJ [Legionella septentrionalis]|uniref:Flagellar biosynthesis protein FlgJ n=1 Tax=Legionella septentrionalis TaxID=2498109 RepID=A0A3S0WQN8_9GAMM|nr:flagellar biosynthesis protein FlgJ [Legionella septentrionalis]RUQ81508.1 flagellar biosynthesis protein FlgJ [Legionella septentrionalis]
MDALRKITLHPKARDFLFENFATLRRIFSDVLGQLGIDYISIALINERGEIFFLSSNPSIEQNLIEKELWECDGIYQEDFINQNEHKLWSELSPIRNPERLKQYKQQHQKLIEGVSIPTNYGIYRAILSFGFKKMNSLVQIKSESSHEKLLAVGKYCLNKISNIVLFPDGKKDKPKPQLTLVINNLGKL